MDRYILPRWIKYSNELKKEILPYPPFSFLNNPIIKKTMFISKASYNKNELKYLKKNLTHKELKSLLLEDYIGKSHLSSIRYFTSGNTIHHLYHLIRYFNKLYCNLHDIDTVIEWGGGYGNLAKIFYRLYKRRITYIIIDLPLFSCIQWLYLSTIFGEKNINLIQTRKDRLLKNKINLIPVNFINSYVLKGTLFISTWALSESNKYCQDMVFRSNWFNCPHLLLAFGKNSKQFPYSENIIKDADKMNIKIEKIEFLKNHYYGYR
ncbi:MAG: putative sugar O-methyltransferase [Promethearchaeota archaeon]